MPAPVYAEGAGLIPIALVIGIVASYFIRRWAKARQAATGQPFPIGWTTLGLVIGLPVLVWALISLFGTNPISFDVSPAGPAST